MKPRMTGRVAASAACTLLLLSSAACTTWHRTAVPTEPQRLPRIVRATLADSSTVALSRAKVSGDSLVGRRYRTGYTFAPLGLRLPGPRTAVSLSDVRRLDEQRVSMGRSVGAVAAFHVAAALFVTALMTW